MDGHLSNYMPKDRDIRITMPEGSDWKAVILAHAASRGETVEQFVMRAIVETIENDKSPQRLDGGHPTMME